jgi:hypothetical protein
VEENPNPEEGKSKLSEGKSKSRDGNSKTLPSADSDFSMP